MAVDHVCPVAWAGDHGLLAGSPVELSWCLSYQRDRLMALTGSDAMDPALLLWQDAPLSVYYAPWDWVNTAASVMLVGITPGLHQAAEALRETRRCLVQGLSNEEALRRADAVGSFSGPMRSHLVTMLDGIGLAGALGVDSAARLFDTHHHLAAHVSAIDYPVFVNGQNYGGRSPSLGRHQVLRSLVRSCLGARVAMAPGALIIPLGTAAQEAVTLLAADGLLDPRRCLTGFPHPSGGNGHRASQYASRREALTASLAQWAARHNSAPDQVGHDVLVAQDADGAGPAEVRGKWVLPVGAGLVTQLRVDHAFTLVLESWIEIRIETSFSYGMPQGQEQFEPSSPAALAPLLRLHAATVTSAEIRKDGGLTLAFADGAVLVVPPHERYEAFTVTGSLPPVRRGFSFVALPGGGLARF